MGYILPDYYVHLSEISKRKVPNILIETGTFKGGIALRYLQMYGTIEPFKKLYTFEIGENISRIASKRFKLFEECMGDTSKFNVNTDEEDLNFKNEGLYFFDTIHLINKDSVSGLANLLSTIDEPCCFWLDAHAGAKKYSRGSKDVPLLDELNVIANHKIKNHIIAIDDTHMFGKIQRDNNTNEILCDYSEFSKELVFDQLLKINNDYIVEEISPYGHQMIVAY